MFQISGFYLKYKIFCQKPAHSYLLKWLCFFQMFIVLGMYNFGQTKKNISDQWCKAILNEEFYDSPAVVIVRRLCLDSTTICTKKNALKFTTKPANETSFFRWFFSKPCLKSCSKTCSRNNLKFFYCRADHDISRTNRNFIIPRFPFKLRRHVDISDWILNWHSVEAVRVRRTISTRVWQL